jgi:GDP-D-mannose dehydratase
MISIDTNLLLYSLNPDSIWHLAAVSFLQQNWGNPAVRFAITDYALV